jgi:hypothetical protein
MRLLESESLMTITLGKHGGAQVARRYGISCLPAPL